MDITLPLSAAQGLARRLVCCVALTSAAAVFAASEPSAITGQKKSFAYSWQQEVQMGAEADREVVEEMGLYENPELQAYIDSVGQRLVATSNFNAPNAPDIYRNTKFTFRIIDSTVVNAFALPGGYVYVTRGLLAHVENEAQLAVVLGHEIGHVVARHSSQQARRNQWGQIGVVLGSILGQKVLGEKVPDIGSTILNAGGKATEMFLLRYSREAENEADELGVTYAARTGYAAAESARFFEALQRLSAAEGNSLPTWQSTHPDPGDRARHVVQLAATVQAGTRGNVGRDDYLRRIDGIVLGDDPREGFAQNGIFYHPTLRFQMPVAPGWKTENQKTAVMFGEPNGKAVMGLKLAPEARSARDAANQFAQKAGLQLVANGDTMINGLPTTVIIGQKQSDQGVLGVWDAFIEMDGHVYSLLGYSPQQNFEQFRPTFESVAAGFSPLRNLEVSDVRPTVLRVVRADRSGPFTSFIPTALPPDMTAEALATMNQVGIDQNVPQGELLKIPEVPQPPQPRSNYERDRSSRRDRYPDYSRPDARRDDPYRGDYPAPSSYPQQPPRYDYPPQNSQNYPQSQPGYPQQPAYPQTNYPPQSYPSSSYPQYPNSSSSSSYPQTGYPPSNYPAQSYPQTSAPQFPQPPGARQNQSTQPTWPR